MDFCFFNSLLGKLVTHYDIGITNNDVCQGTRPFGNPAIATYYKLIVSNNVDLFTFKKHNTIVIY